MNLADLSIRQRVERVIANSMPVPECGCWLWMGGVSGCGYAMGRPDGQQHKQLIIHRWLFKKLRNIDIGDLTLDHLCRVRSCINPDHLEPVPNAVNVLRGFGPPAENKRKTHCGCGLAYDKAHKREGGSGVNRRCSVCTSAMRCRVKLRKLAKASS